MCVVNTNLYLIYPFHINIWRYLDLYVYLTENILKKVLCFSVSPLVRMGKSRCSQLVMEAGQKVGTMLC